MSSLKIGETEYIVGMMPAMKQLQIARRITGPLSASVTPETLSALMKLKPPAEGKPEDASEAERAEQIGIAGTFIRAVGAAMSAMSDADFEYVLNGCLDHVSRGDGKGHWHPLRINGNLMFQDLGPAEMLRLATFVISEKLRSFMPALREGLTSPPPQGQN